MCPATQTVSRNLTSSSPDPGRHESRPWDEGTRSAPLLIAAGLLISISGLAMAQNYAPGWELPQQGYSSDVALEDFDLDGDLDAYVTNDFGADRLWLNDGAGIFTESALIVSQVDAMAAAIGLFDGDLFPDLFLSKVFSPASIWLDDGSAGTLLFHQDVGPGVIRGGASLADVDQDNDLDVLVSNVSGSLLGELWLNDGNGSFSDSGQAFGTASSRHAALLDITADSYPEGFFAGNTGLKLFLNDGAGTLTDSGLTFSGTTSAFDLGLARLDANGSTDIFLTRGSTSGEPNKVLFRSGSDFVDSGQLLGNENSLSVTLFDADGDLDIDAFVGNDGSQMDHLWLNDGSGTFSDAGETLGIESAIGVAHGDLDGDLDLDVFVANHYNPDRVWLNDGVGHFTRTSQALGSMRPVSATTGDVDGDGDLDAVFGVLGGTVRILGNDGSGAFDAFDDLLGIGQGGGAGGLVLADLDGDLDKDLYVAVYLNGDDLDRVFWNDGSGVFTDSGMRLGGGPGGVGVDSPWAVGGDVDGDLDIDIVAANYGDNTLWRNDGSGNLTAETLVGTTLNSQAVRLWDLDGDLDLDLFVANFAEADEVWLNDGAGNFSNSGQALGLAQSTSIDLIDINGDTFVDAVVGAHGANLVWLNDGTATFTDSGQTLGTSRTKSVHLIDVDGDSDSDIWETNGESSAEANRIWLNDGTGVFTLAPTTYGLEGSQESAIGDFDASGYVDILVANSFGASRVWLDQRGIEPEIFADDFESGDTTAWQ